MMPRAGWLVVPLLLYSCGDPPPLSVARFQPVPLGDGELTIGYCEFQASAATMTVEVHFRWTGPPQDLLPGMFRGRKLKLSVLDSVGHRYSPKRPASSPIDPVPEGIFHILSQLERFGTRSQTNPITMREAVALSERLDLLEREMKEGRYPHDWVQCFALPLESKGLTLQATNPSPRRHQPASISVALGR